MKKILLSLLLVLAACSKMNSNDLFIYASMEEELADKLIRTYQTETGNSVKFVRLPTGEAAARIDAEKKNPQSSLWLGGVGMVHSHGKYKGLTESYFPKGSEKIDQKFRDKDGNWTGLYMGIMAIIVNPEALKKHKLSKPSSWTDLLKPEYKGHIQVANPGTSGTGYTFVSTLIHQLGEDKAFEYLKELNKNISQYTRSGVAPIRNVILGETAIAIAFAHDAIRLNEELKSNLDLVFPKEGTGYEIAAVSMIKGGKQSEDAKKLFDWLYTPSASQILADFYLIPFVKNNSATKNKSLKIENIKINDLDTDSDGKDKERLVEKWNDSIRG